MTFTSRIFNGTIEKEKIMMLAAFPEWLSYPQVGWWVIVIMSIFLVYLIGFKMGYGRGKKG
jgi:hypothetical protein